MLQLAAVALAFCELGLHRGQVFLQACVEQLLSQVGEIGLRVDRPQVLGQSQGRPEVGRMHDFEVLLVLPGGATGQLIDPLAHVPGILNGLKVIKGCEKVIVPRLLGGGNKRAHGKYVDQLVVELLIGKSVGCGLALVATNRLRGQAAGRRRCFVKREGFGVDAEVVFRGLADEAFRVHGARQVRVQIGALGHVVKEGVKGERSLLAGMLEGSSGAGFAILRDGLRLCDGGRRQANQRVWQTARRMSGRQREHSAGEGNGRALQDVWTSERPVYDSVDFQEQRVLRTAKSIAILTFVACAQLLTWPGPPPEAADSDPT